MASTCNICGSTEFILGPGGRTSRLGALPQCKGCNSLERHRIIRRIYQQLPVEVLAASRTLQLSHDLSIDPGWFRSYEVSTYGGSNSIDIQEIDRPARQYELVICNHVLEHVDKDKQALLELLRITTDDGILQIAVPDPLGRQQTDDWGHPNWDDHGHYRIYGSDFLERLKPAIADVNVCDVVEIDSVTGTQDIVYFFTKSASIHYLLRHVLFKGMALADQSGLNTTAIIEQQTEHESVTESAHHSSPSHQAPDTSH